MTTSYTDERENAMLNFNRDSAKSADKSAIKPAPYPYAPTAPGSGAGNSAAKAPVPVPAAAQPGAAPQAPVLVNAVPESAARAIGPDTPGSQLFVGPNIKLKGVEISDCDVLIVEGQVEATVNSKAMQIAKPGTLKGVAVIDVAEIDGEFSGELTAHSKLIVRGTGRVSGKIRYGRLIVADGGEISGDVQRIDAAAAPQVKVEPAAPFGRAQLSPQPPG
jgi:cytoskeletal protein CcmA (bactofilin family)